MQYWVLLPAVRESPSLGPLTIEYAFDPERLGVPVKWSVAGPRLLTVAHRVTAELGVAVPKLKECGWSENSDGTTKNPVIVTLSIEISDIPWPVINTHEIVMLEVRSAAGIKM